MKRESLLMSVNSWTKARNDLIKFLFKACVCVDLCYGLCEEGLKMKHGAVRAVSYTHLDVYKRQCLTQIIAVIGFMFLLSLFSCPMTILFHVRSYCVEKINIRLYCLNRRESG